MTLPLLLLSFNPVTALYALQAATYAASAVLTYRQGHGVLMCATYSASAVIHGIMAMVHYIH